jgi:hypothetical protein
MALHITQKVDRRAARTWLLLPEATRVMFPVPVLFARDPERNQRELTLLAVDLGVQPPALCAPVAPPPNPASKPKRLGLAGYASVRRMMRAGMSKDEAEQRVRTRQRKAARAH